MNRTTSTKKQIIEQIDTLRTEVRRAIRTQDITLTLDHVLAYGRIMETVMLKLKPQSPLLQYTMKEAESLQDSKSRGGALGQLKWLDNRLKTLKTTLNNLSQGSKLQDIEFHPKVIATSQKLFQDGHYPQAIFETFKALEQYVKEKSQIKDKRTTKLMSHVFNEQNPILSIKCSRPEVAQEEQQGFKFLLMGSMLGIRNPKGHYTITQRDRVRTLQYLAFASLLFKTVDDAKVTIPKSKVI